MLLRRVIDHVRKQEWTAIAIDFVIVVIGVFMGIQLGNLNEEYADARTKAQLVERLKADLVGMKASFQRQDELAGRLQYGWVYLLRSLEQCEVAPDRQDAVQFALERYQSWLSPEIQRVAFDEMKATGVFSRLADAGLQNDTTELYTILETWEQDLAVTRANHLAAGRVLWKSVAFSFDSDEPNLAEFDAGIAARFNPVEHCDNLELRGAVWEIVDSARDWLKLSADSVKEIDDILSRLEARLLAR